MLCLCYFASNLATVWQKLKKMLKQAFGDDALGQTQTYNWLTV
jgi:hypothetical protein